MLYKCTHHLSICLYIYIYSVQIVYKMKIGKIENNNFFKNTFFKNPVTFQFVQKISLHYTLKKYKNYI